MIRHDKTHYDRTVGQMAYVYSIYAHLQYDSVYVNVNDMVSAGSVIARSNNSGNSSAPHLHIQINLSTDQTRTDPEDYAWSNNSSRNPELWLSMFDYGGVTTAKAVGKLTDVSGNPVAGKLIWGMEKPLAAEGDAGNNFLTARTYAYTWANPDDIYGENFGTTDVLSGTYHLYAHNPDNTLYKDLGNYTFTAGKTTYIGLYPSYLPDVRQGVGGWEAKIAIQNPSSDRTAQVVTTFFEWSAGLVRAQRTDFLAPRQTLLVTPPGAFLGSALAVGSEPLAVVVESTHTGNTVAAAYTGVKTPETSAYLPMVYNTASNRSVFIAHNVGVAPNGMTAAATYYSTTGVSYGSIPSSVALHANWQDAVPPSGLSDGAAVLTAPEPAAASSRVEWYTNGLRTRASHYTGATTGRAKLYAPSIYRTKFADASWNIISGVRLQNLTANAITVSLSFAPRSDAPPNCQGNFLSFQDSIPSYSSHGYNTRDGGYRNGVFDANLFTPLGNNNCTEWSGTLTATVGNGAKSVAGVVNTVWVGGNRAGTYALLGPEDAAANLALARQMYTTGVSRSAINVMNVSGSSVTMEVRYYNSNGGLAYGPVTATLQPNQAVGYNTDTLSGFPTPFDGSAIVSTTNGAQALIAIGNLIYTTLAPGGDRAAVYEGVGF